MKACKRESVTDEKSNKLNKKTLTRRYEKRKEKINNSKTDEKALRSYRS